MKKSNLWIIGVATTIATVIGLSAIFGERHWGYYGCAAQEHRRHHYQNGRYDNREPDKKTSPNERQQDSAQY